MGTKTFSGMMMVINGCVKNPIFLYQLSSKLLSEQSDRIKEACT